MLLCLGFMNSNPATNLVWIDLEMTGFDPAIQKIIQIACIITTQDLELVATAPEIIIHQPDDVIVQIDCTDAVLNSFFESGFIDSVRNSTISTEEAEETILQFIKSHVSKGVSPLCGNSVHTDRSFIYKHMPKLNSFLHYRNLDVTTLKQLCSRWRPDIPDFKKKETHRALEDIQESIEQLKYYRANFLKLN